ncbi:ribose-phosphate diphosphokinase [soil metagenome]
MIIFSNRAAAHLVDNMNLPKGNAIIKQFSDGELYIKIESDIANKEIWVIACTQAPAKNLLELFFILDALTRMGAPRINLFFPYFGYARQAIAQVGEAGSAERICKILQQFPLGIIKIMHVHAAPRMRNFLTFDNIIDIDFFCNIAAYYDCIAAPDKGAAEFAQKIAQVCHKEVVFLKKVRPDHEQVKIESLNGNVIGKKILLVDDIISTGRTIIEAAQVLKNGGALEISAAATHGILSQGALERFAKSVVKKIYVTNTLKNSQPDSIAVYDTSHFIETIIRQTNY